ncbi:YtxH domain-containing protein [Dolosigranulum pigrum]|uniref:YtxH domain-containing protein n=1 Tax=Dolosigranulum pigrum TaxID=29394 RepID=UPI000DC023C7|nr:YtxH domain-containing protein [Dolosigranulum pigrum]QTJ41494.1 YtxH domain-containing protein [Dolosigranulum pigrum]QTJ58455.1 YtxH domain-containing protein [Dolosigranulum pigrum]RAN58814.1 hypothetical protein B8A46_06715 [Dolosigranulum pigrum]
MSTAKDKFGAGLVFGSLLGAAGAYLFAPQSGETFQKKVKHKTFSIAHEGLEIVIDQLDQYIAHEEAWQQDHFE